MNTLHSPNKQWEQQTRYGQSHGSQSNLSGRSVLVLFCAPRVGSSEQQLKQQHQPNTNGQTTTTQTATTKHQQPIGPPRDGSNEQQQEGSRYMGLGFGRRNPWLIHLSLAFAGTHLKPFDSFMLLSICE